MCVHASAWVCVCVFVRMCVCARARACLNDSMLIFCIVCCLLLVVILCRKLVGQKTKGLRTKDSGGSKSKCHYSTSYNILVVFTNTTSY